MGEVPGSIPGWSSLFFFGPLFFILSCEFLFRRSQWISVETFNCENLIITTGQFHKLQLELVKQGSGAELTDLIVMTFATLIFLF